MATVRDILRSKGDTIWSASPDMHVYDALKVMADKNVGALLVLDGDRLVGIFSERDYARKIILLGRSSRESYVRDIMTRDVQAVTRENSVEDCMALMTDKRIRHLPVVENERVIGLISIGDVVRAIIEEKDGTIRDLHSFITGR